MTFGERLKSLREDNDERQRDIAAILFVSPNILVVIQLLALFASLPSVKHSSK